MIVICPHCHFQLAGADMPTHIEPGMICPVCGNDMSAKPVLPITGLQVLVKYIGSIIAGLTLGVIIISLLSPILDWVFGTDGPLVGLMVFLGLFLMFAVGSTMDVQMQRRVHSQKARWILLGSPFVLCPIFWWLVITFA